MCNSLISKFQPLKISTYKCGGVVFFLMSMVTLRNENLEHCSFVKHSSNQVNE